MAQPSTSPAEELPSERTRTVLSFLLFVHLFAVACGVIGNALPASPLRRHLADIPGIRDYLSLLRMNLAYAFHLTYALDEDTPQWLAIEAEPGALTDPVSASAGPAADGAAQSEVVVFPEDDLGPGLRAGRYRNLLLQAYLRARDESQASLIPRAIAERVLEEEGIGDTTKRRIRLQRRNLRAIEDLGSADLSQRDRFAPSLVETAYEGDVWFSDRGLEIVKPSSALESAALRGSASGRRESKPAVGDKPPNE